MDRRKRITEGESPGTALPQLATASDRWTTQLDTARQSYRRNFYPCRIRTRVNRSVHRVMQLLMSLTTVQTYLSFKFLFLNIALLFFLFFEGTDACLVKI